MPRIEFNNLSEAETWIKEKILKSDKNYEGYFTSSNELILIPNKSTRPIVYGYIKLADKTAIKNTFKDTSIPIYTCKHYEWNPERGMTKE